MLNPHPNSNSNSNSDPKKAKGFARLIFEPLKMAG